MKYSWYCKKLSVPVTYFALAFLMAVFLALVLTNYIFGACDLHAARDDWPLLG